MPGRTRPTDRTRARAASWRARWPARAEAHCGTPGSPHDIALARRTCRHAPDNEPSELLGSESNRPRPAVRRLEEWSTLGSDETSAVWLSPSVRQVFAQNRVHGLDILFQAVRSVLYAAVHCARDPHERPIGPVPQNGILHHLHAGD